MGHLDFIIRYEFLTAQTVFEGSKQLLVRIIGRITNYNCSTTKRVFFCIGIKIREIHLTVFFSTAAGYGFNNSAFSDCFCNNV